MTFAGAVIIKGVQLDTLAGVTVRNMDGIISRAVRSNDTPNPVDDGTIYGADSLDAKKLTADIFVDVDPADFDDTLQQLSALFAPQRDDTIDVQFTIGNEASRARVIHGRPRNYNVQIGNWGQASILAEIVCADPRMYEVFSDFLFLVPSISVGGLTFPLTFPMTFATNIDSPNDTGIANNAGTANAPYQAYFFGPCSNPKLTHLGSGKFLYVLGDFEAGTYGYIDSRTRSVQKFVGGADTGENIYHLLSVDSDWFDLAPGGNELQYHESAGFGTQCFITFTSAWI